MPTGDVHEATARYAAQNRIAYVHFRNITGKAPHYQEQFVDEGDIDMRRIVHTLRENRFGGVLIPDHTPQMTCAAPWHAGMAHAPGYMKAVLDQKKVASMWTSQHHSTRQNLDKLKIIIKMCFMRTTLNISDGLLEELREKSRKEKRPMTKVIEETLRRGLSAESAIGVVPHPQIRTFPVGIKPAYQGMSMNQLYDQLESETPRWIAE